MYYNIIDDNSRSNYFFVGSARKMHPNFADGILIKKWKIYSWTFCSLSMVAYYILNCIKIKKYTCSIALSILALSFLFMIINAKRSTIPIHKLERRVDLFGYFLFYIISMFGVVFYSCFL